ncbi:hypothetical protein GCM10020331_085710 [Ectobacillus funiculus]
MLSISDRITTPQAIIIVINYILGTGILTLPRAATEKVKTTDVWLTVILGGLIAMLAGWIIVKLSQQFPEKNLLSIQPSTNREMVGNAACFFIWFAAAAASFFISKLKEGNHETS